MHSPGQPLPDFPTRTHCHPSELAANPDLRPYTTLNQALATIPHTASFHNPQDPQLRRNRAAYDGNKPFEKTVLCAGKFLHPSGRRLLTLRELAVVQGFPATFEFHPGVEGHVRKQIGNAVPASVAKVFFEKVIRALKDTDGRP